MTLFQFFTILARRMIGRVNEYIAFLLFRAFEMQGEVEEAFGHAVIYRALDPQVRIAFSYIVPLRSTLRRLLPTGYRKISQVKSRIFSVFFAYVLKFPKYPNRK